MNYTSTTHQPELGPRTEDDSQYNLVVARNMGHVLMGHKTRGFGRGKLVFPGGKEHYFVGPNGIYKHPPREYASQETLEETGLWIPANNLLHVGVLYVQDDDDNRDVQIYTADMPRLHPQDSDELTDVAWLSEASLNYGDMPDDYRLWLPHVLGGHAVIAFLETQDGAIIASSVSRRPIAGDQRWEAVA